MSGYIGVRNVPTLLNGGGVWSLNEVAKFKKDGIWPYNDPYFPNVSLLLHGNGANNSTTFTDSSLNNLTVIGSGNAKISMDQSKFGGSSIYFYGGNIQVSYATPINLSGTGSWTLEFFINMQTLSGNKTLFEFRGSGNPSDGWSLWLNTNNKLQTYDANNGGALLASSNAITSNTWMHVALVKNGSSSNNMTWYIDGVANGVFTVASWTATSSTGLRIGLRQDGLEPFNGYMDEIRITKGIARYTANFTVPSGQFPS